MKTFKQYITESVSYSDWMSGKEAAKHITKAQFKTIGKHLDHQVYTSGIGHLPKYRVDTKSDRWTPSIVRHIQVHHPGTNHTIEWHISRHGKYYAHTIYKHHSPGEPFTQPVGGTTIVKHRQID